MASSDWIEPANTIDASIVARGVTKAIGAPPGGGGFVFGFSTILDGTAGCAALRNAAVNMDPMDNGGSVRAAIQRAPSFVDGGFAPFVFLSLQSDDVTDDAYMLGLSDEEPARIVLRRGPIVDGFPGVTIGSDGVLAVGDVGFAHGEWVHLRLDAEIGDSGDTTVTVYQNDLSIAPIGTPAIWVPISGIPSSVVEVSGLVGGFAGFGYRTEEDRGKAAFFDQVAVYRQIL